MASESRGGGPGTSKAHGVVSTLSSPFAKAAGAGRSSGPSANHAPFDTPQSTGGGGIPTQFFDRTTPTTKAGTQSPGGVSTNSRMTTIRADR